LNRDKAIALLKTKELVTNFIEMEDLDFNKSMLQVLQAQRPLCCSLLVQRTLVCTNNFGGRKMQDIAVNKILIKT